MKKFKLIWILYAVMLLATVMSANALNTSGSLAYMKLDETSGTSALNSVSNGSGTANNIRVFTSAFNGIINTGADFTQGDDWIDLGTLGNPRNDITMCYWQFGNNADGASNGMLGNSHNQVWAGIGYMLGQQGDTGGANYRKYIFVVGRNEGNGQILESARFDENNTLNFICGVFKGNDYMKIYRNGVEIASASTTITQTPSTGYNWVIGREWRTASTNYANVKMDEVYILNEAKSQNWISELYQVQLNNNDSCAQYPVFNCVIVADNFSVSLRDKNTNALINDFTVNVNGTVYSSTTGSVVTDLEQNSSLNVNLSFYNIGGSGTETHYNFLVQDVNINSTYTGLADQFVLNVQNIFTNASLNGSVYSRATVCVDPPCSFINSGSIVNGEYKGVLNDPSITENDLIIVVDDYYNKSFVNYDLTTPLSLNMTPYYYIISQSYTGIVNHSTESYVRNLNYTLSVVCPTFINSSFVIFATNSTEVYTPQCNNETSFIISGAYTYFEEGAFNFTLGLNSSEEDLSVNASTLNLISDLYNPVINASMLLPQGFNNQTAQLSLLCTDNVSPVLDYLMVYNNGLIYNDTKTANTTQNNTSNLIHGNNVFNVECSDFFSSTTQTLTQNAYFKTINLIDEVDNVAFNVANLSSARLYYDDNSSFYDFKAESKNSVNFSSTNISQLRLELGYPENVFITRWIDVSVFSNINPIRLCANKDNVVHFEQFITSSVLKTVFLKNIYANCYVAGDKTRFAFKDGLILRAYTITGSYSLYTVEGLNQVLLASVDGAIRSDIFLDQLQFRRESFTVTILPDLISFNKQDVPAGALRIYYLNTNLDNYGLTINIKHGETGELLFSESTFVNFNEANIVFNYATISNVNDTTLLVLEVVKTNQAGQQTTIRRYFNTSGKAGQFRSEIAGFIALFVLLFGFTFTSTNQTYGWFGMIISILTFGFLSFALTAWYVVFLQAMSASLMIYCIVVLSKDSAGGFFT